MVLQLENVFIAEVLGTEPVLLVHEHSAFGQLLLVRERRRRARLCNSNPRQTRLALGFSFILPLVLMVDSTEVGDDDGNGKRDHKHSAQRANAANNFTGNRLRHHVAVTQSCHRHNRVPESGRNGCEVRSVDILLGVKHDSCKNDDCHGEGEHEEAEFGGARFQRVAENSQALRVTWELENSKHAEHSKRHESARHVVVVLHEQTDVVGHDGYHVDDWHDATHESASVGCRKQPKQIFRGENHHARRVQAEKDDLIALSARERSSSSRPVTAWH